MFEMITPIDYKILDAIQGSLSSPALDSFFGVVTHLGDSGIIWVLCTIVFLFTKRLRFIGIASTIAFFFVVVFGEFGIKLLVARLRPFVQDPSIQLIIDAPSGYSFPSIHAASSLATATVVAALPFLNKQQGKANDAKTWIFVGAIVTLAVLIAFSRLYVQVHFPSDVLAGTIFGILCGLAGLLIAQKLADTWALKHPDHTA